MQQGGAERGVGGAEVDGEVEGAGEAAAGLDDRRAVVVAVEADVVRGQGDGARGGQVQRVDFVVRAVGRLRVDGDGLDDVRTEDVVGAGGADGVVGAVEADGVLQGGISGLAVEFPSDGGSALGEHNRKVQWIGEYGELGGMLARDDQATQTPSGVALT